MHASSNKIALAAIILFTGVSPVFAVTNNMPSIPNGWKVIKDHGTVIVSQRGTEPTYVQVVDIKSGAKVRSIYSQVGTSNAFYKQTLNTWWNSSSNNTALVSMVNGQFFDNSGKNPTTLSFGVRAGGRLLTHGSDSDGNANKQVEFRDNVGAIIGSKNPNILEFGTSSEVIVSFGANTPKNTGADARTYLCTRPTTLSPWVIIISVQSKTHAATLADLNAWGCADTHTVILDGGGSTGLITFNSSNTIINMRKSGNENRSIPHALAVSYN